jgi:hypothetical protein
LISATETTIDDDTCPLWVDSLFCFTGVANHHLWGSTRG